MRRGHAIRVAAATTAAIAAVYVVCVVVVNLIIAAHLSGQTSARLADRLHDLSRNPAELSHQVNKPGVVSDGDADDADDASPIIGWVLSPGNQVTASTPGAPSLPAGVIAAARDGRAVTASLGTAGTFRLKAARSGPSLIVVGASLAGQARVQQWLLIGELTAGPFLLLAMFAGSLLIGLRAQAPVEQSRRRQLEFTADASHELRTPLSVIRAETDLALATPRKAADYRDALVRIKGESERLRRLVEDMLWLARFDSEPPPLEEGPVDVATVARGCADRFRSVGPAISAAVTGEPVLINAPPDWIDRLAGVLLDNACRYAGPDGQVLVAVAVNGNRGTLTVEDSGPGIPAELRPRLFDRFSRATEQTSGTGLGLAIGDSVVRSTSGRWDVGESPMGGARFAVSWRLAQPHRIEPDLHSAHREQRAADTAKETP
ncbi:MAG TPA: HAMP domain-containing sensor histidine kinase [Trebonia sp.]|jgi:signal transduction histidine kinase|nr:HAMP domain-containing sensor histidine kinase [Trebonia sp.]